MPIVPSYPGVYIEEVPSGVRTITGVATSVAAVIDQFARGPMNEPVQVLSWADFERTFGGLDALSEGSYALQQFFANGGQQSWVVRVGAGGAAASVAMSDAGNGGAVMNVVAADEGTWGNNVRLRVEALDATTFNLYISEVVADGARLTVLRQEVFRNLTEDNVATIVNDPNSGSRLALVDGVPSGIPMANGTIGTAIGAATVTIPADSSLTISLNGATAIPIELDLPAGAASLSTAAAALQDAIRAADAANRTFSNATVSVVVDQFYVLPGTTGDATATFTFADGASTTATALGLAAATPNVAAYQLGVGDVGSSAQIAGGVPGVDPVVDATTIIGSRAAKSGIFALEDADLFNILCIPAIANLGANQATAVTTVAGNYAEERRAFFILDSPDEIDTPNAIRQWVTDNDTTIRHPNIGLFFPRVLVPDPLDDFRLREIGPSGTLAGIFARTDTRRGVWKAPAGTEATLSGVSELAYVMTDGENGILNPLAINCLRNFPVYGTVSWGSRTLVGADQQASEWKYIPVRRLALYLEESLYRGTKWVVFEPNAEPLWAQIRLNVGAFMHDLYRQGAFFGTTPQQAYIVACDATTTTQTDIDNGIVNILVGFAPLKPAEFVIIRIQQLAGQTA